MEVCVLKEQQIEHYTDYEEGIYVGYRYYNTQNVKVSLKRVK